VIHESCGITGCSGTRAWDVPRAANEKPLALCEEHANRWLTGERDYFAELDAVAGRKHKPRPGTLKALLASYGPRAKRLSASS